ncbi:hypothetical protein A3A21_00530 [Candidatus Jorgensenbacteria bacterium RIFCSPLOWO2_01_FULL_45_25b]|uniref:Uncharacterized protein n=2 Tax=Parcubacteria group TaxID=1794811 RepID=A0A1F6BU65_9BACT|nr:MAG: hypothetical protein A2819_00745 [Candidatus Azambacteria bacterium RIFCSPHIGHO2_01_FULL_40_24]OGG40461.1 MAG: hypothetical protein A3A21_00530 [Candidatus Jorgensenbacteria bacterium RIFCSPLOWO2_01_FULL_45_25b]
MTGDGVISIVDGVIGIGVFLNGYPNCCSTTGRDSSGNLVVRFFIPAPMKLDTTMSEIMTVIANPIVL